MDERGANIDVLFRNGLKDYEVLPPANAWDNIKPVIRKNHQPYVILRAAAMVAVVVSLSFLAYKLGMQVSSEVADSGIIITPESDTRYQVSGNFANIQAVLIPSAQGNLPQAGIEASRDAVTPVKIQDENISRESGYLPVFSDLPENNLIGSRKSNMVIQREAASASLLTDAEPVQFMPETPADDISRRWTIAALVSPTYYSTILSGNSDLAGRLNADEKSLFSYSGGVSLSYKLNRRLSVQSGLYYSSVGQMLKGISSFGGFQQYDYTKGDHNFEVMTSSGTVYTSNTDVFLRDNLSSERIQTRYTNDVFDPSKANLQYLDNNLRQNFGFLEFPVVLRYKVVDKGIDFNIIGGFSSNILVSNSVYATLSDGKYPVGKTAGLNLLTFSSSLGMGMEYSLSKNFSFNLEPTLRYYLSPFDNMSGVRIHPYSFGVFSGLSYKF